MAPTGEVPGGQHGGEDGSLKDTESRRKGCAGPRPPTPLPLPPALGEESPVCHLSPGHLAGRKLAHGLIFLLLSSKAAHGTQPRIPSTRALGCILRNYFSSKIKGILNIPGAHFGLALPCPECGMTPLTRAGSWR